jgi:cytochrome c-type protein NapB
MRHVLAFAALALAASLAIAQAPKAVDAMRGVTPVGDESRPPPLGNVENKDVRRERAYSMQPPTIPHKIDGYQVDRNVNACLGCHSRGRAPVTQAVAVSVSHYMDRDGNFLAEISPRRYFCEQCHVPQVDAKPLVGNSFVDVDEILRRPAAAAPAKAPAKR